jgi:ankyrin repeat protein
VELLLQKEAEVDEPGNDGRTPLSWAVENEREDIVELLLKTGKVDVNSSDNNDQTPLAWAKEMGNEVIVELLQSFITT